MNDSTWGKDGTGVACGEIDDLGEDEGVKKVEVFVTVEGLVDKFGRDDALKRISGLIQSCLTRALVDSDLTQAEYASLSKQIYEQWGASPLIALKL